MKLRTCIASLIIGLPALAAAAAPWFGIRVVDAETGEGIPLAELRTVNEMAFLTDNAGRIAFHEPAFMEREVFFHVASPGYEMPKDGFGFRGVRLTPKSGAETVVKLKRVNIAHRVARLTGAALYRDSELLGAPVPMPNSAEVLGQDSVQGARYNGRLFFLWGDTSVARYPLGNFRTTSAWLPADAHPSRGLSYEYLQEPGKLRELRKMLPLDGKGAAWMFGLHVLPGDNGREVLLSGFSVHLSLAERTRQGIARFDDEKGVFTVAADVDNAEKWRTPRGVTVRHGGHVYFASPFLHTRVAATVADFTNPKSYEAFRFDPASNQWSWQREAPPTMQSDRVPAEHERFALKNAEGAEVRIHTASVKWNAWRKRWVLIGVQSGGKDDPSVLGEVWYAESASPEGPWKRAVKVATHPRYSFYNPVHHDFFDSEDGRVIWFEGTYTREFSGNPVATPRYDYNQLMYRLDLADPRLVPAHAD